MSMNGKKNKTFLALVPDTITSWFVTGFALSPTTGLGIINEPLTLTVKSTFYIVVHLPYSIRRGEVAAIQVMIHNFLGDTLPTDVHLYNENDEFEFVDQSINDTKRRTKLVLVPGNSSRRVTFLIKANKIGEIIVYIKVLNKLKEDSARHILRVDPESQFNEKIESRYIDHKRHQSSNSTIYINIPRNYIVGSVKTSFALDPNFVIVVTKYINDYRVKLRWKGLIGHEFIVDENSAHKNYSAVIPSDVRQVFVEVDGAGHGLYKISYQYCRELENARHKFDLDVVLMDNSTYYVQHLKVCTKYRKREVNRRSNLAYVEVFFPSGIYVSNDNSIEDLSIWKEIMKVELNNQGTNVRIYYSSLGTESSCFTVTAERRHDVALHRPAYVIVYDTVENDSFAIKKYDGIVKQPCDICQDEDCKVMVCE